MLIGGHSVGCPRRSSPLFQIAEMPTVPAPWGRGRLGHPEKGWRDFAFKTSVKTGLAFDSSGKIGRQAKKYS